MTFAEVIIMILLPSIHQYLQPITKLPVKLKRFLIQYLNPQWYKLEEGFLLMHNFTFSSYFKLKILRMNMKKSKKLRPITESKKIMLLYMKEGDIDVTHTELGDFILKENHYYLFCMPTGKKNQVFLKPGNYQTLILDLDFKWISKFKFNQTHQQVFDQYQENPALGFCLFECGISPLLKCIIDKIENEVVHDPLKIELFIKRKKRKLLDIFIDDYEHSCKRKKEIDDDLFQKVLEYINGNLDCSTILKTTATHFKLTESQLRLRFKKYMNIVPHRYILNLRMTEAGKMVQESDINIAEISYRLGYEDYSGFCRQFKIFHGMKPFEMRNIGNERLIV